MKYILVIIEDESGKYYIECSNARFENGRVLLFNGVGTQVMDVSVESVRHIKGV